MIRLTKQCDYGIVLMAELAAEPEADSINARELATRSQLPLPMVSKILKELVRGGLLDSHRGARGGYSLARAPEAITLTEIIDVLEGPVAITDCSHESGGGSCYLEFCCRMKTIWQNINVRIRDVFDGFTLAELTESSRPNGVARQATLEASQEGL
jgi:FeS assembly SUF system regulator